MPFRLLANAFCHTALFDDIGGRYDEEIEERLSAAAAIYINISIATVRDAASILMLS